MNIKKLVSLLLVAILSISLLAACSPAEDDEDTGNGDAVEDVTPDEDEEDTDSASGETINVISREDASGTRGAFVEIVGVMEDDQDNTYIEAVIQNSTNGVMTTVAGDEYSIGYVSLGSLNDTIKAINVDGVEATAENVQSGEFPISRPFNLAWQEGLSDLAQDFLDYIMSEEGQVIVEENGFVQVENNGPYAGTGGEGNIVVAGSTSVTPVMEKLAEAYRALHDGVNIEIQSTGSSAGMTSAIEGTADIGMASRDLKDEENDALESLAMAIDGIAVIVHLDNPIEDISMDQVKQVFVGEITTWGELE